jgi:hypothetical protein
MFFNVISSEILIIEVIDKKKYRDKIWRLLISIIPNALNHQMSESLTFHRKLHILFSSSGMIYSIPAVLTNTIVLSMSN